MLRVKMNRSIVSSLMPSISVVSCMEYVSGNVLSFPNGQYQGIVLKVKHIIPRLTFLFVLRNVHGCACRQDTFTHRKMTQLPESQCMNNFLPICEKVNILE